MNDNRVAEQKALSIYFVLACAISWALMIPAFTLAAWYGYALPSPVTFGQLITEGFEDRRHFILSLMLVLSQGPLIAAVIASAFQNGRKGLNTWWRRVTRWQVGTRGYLSLFVLLGALYLPVFLFGWIIGVFPVEDSVMVPVIYIIPFFIYEFFTSGMEEPGWRGFALPNLQRRYEARKSSWILGLVWGLWHWPVFIENYYQAASDPTTPIPAAIISTIIQFLLYVGISIIPMTFIHTWLYNRTQSAFMSILLHTFANVLSAYTLAAHPTLGMSGGIIRWVVAILLLRFFWWENEAGKSP